MLSFQLVSEAFLTLPLHLVFDCSFYRTGKVAASCQQFIQEFFFPDVSSSSVNNGSEFVSSGRFAINSRIDLSRCQMQLMTEGIELVLAIINNSLDNIVDLAGIHVSII